MYFLKHTSILKYYFYQNIKTHRIRYSISPKHTLYVMLLSCLGHSGATLKKFVYCPAGGRNLFIYLFIFFLGGGGELRQ